MSSFTKYAAVALIFFILGWVLGTRHLNQEKEKIYAGAVKITVVAASTDLPSTTVLKKSDLTTKQVYKHAVGNNVHPEADIESLTGKTVVHSLKENEPIWKSHIR